MQPSAVRILYVALLAAFCGVSSVAAVGTKHPAPHRDNPPNLLGYIHTVEMTKVEAGAKLWKIVESIPIDADVPIGPEQEADLRDWLYDFLVAFSASGNDSLAAEFYLRAGVNNPAALQRMQKTLEKWGIPQGDAPFDLFRALHRAVFDDLGYEYRFGNAFFGHSTFKVFEMQGRYTSYRSRPQDITAKFKLQKEIEQALRAGEKRLFTDISFVIEEPPHCTPFFCRLVWDAERGLWRFVEVVYNSNRPNSFLFSAI